MQCPQCGSGAVVQDKNLGQKICTRCGLVLLDKILSSKPEWHTEPGKRTGRADVSSGSDITQHDLGLGSRLGNSRDLSPAWRAKLRRLRKWHRRSRAVSYYEKSLRQALINLDKLCEDLFLPKAIKAEVSALFRKAKRKEITTGRDTWNLLGALIFIVLRIRGVPRTEYEVTEAIMKRNKMEEKEAVKALRRNRKVLARELDLEIPRSSPKEYLDRFASRLDLPKRVQAEAHKICSSLPRKFKTRKAAFLVAAAILYNASRRFEGQLKIREIAKKLGVGVSSVSKTGKKIRELLSDQEE